MDAKDQIKRAMGAHGLWRTRLCQAIEAGRSEMTPEQAACDDQCDFGRWIHGPALATAERGNPHYKACRDLHAEFHRRAGEVLRLAGGGRKADAQRAMQPDGAFSQASARLSDAMLAWMRA